MTKSELIAELADVNHWLPPKDVANSVNTILQAMSQALINGNRIEIRGFGSFALNIRPERVGRNPRSGEKVIVSAKRVAHFKAGKELRQRVDAGKANG